MDDGASTSAPPPPPFRECLVVPGDDVTSPLAAVAASVKLGQGLSQAGSRVVCTRAGVLSFLEPNRFFVVSSCARFVPAVGDCVVGVVVERAPEHYRVRVRGTALALLPALAFDGASRRNKPSLAPGALVFARVAACSKHMEPELSCAALPGSGVRAPDWVTGQAVFGELRGGVLAAVPTALARRLLDPTCALLRALGAAFPFEVAVGLNGLVWAHAGSSRNTAAVARALEAAALVPEAACADLVRAALQAMEGGGGGGVALPVGGAQALAEEGDDEDANMLG